jgi:hypothetical protein
MMVVMYRIGLRPRPRSLCPRPEAPQSGIEGRSIGRRSTPSGASFEAFCIPQKAPQDEELLLKQALIRVRRQLPLLRYPRSSAAANGKQPVVAAAFARRKRSFVADQRGAVAFETVLVYITLVLFLLLPLADVAVAGVQYISAWAALRSFGQYLQYNPPADVTNTSGWPAQTTVGGYTMSNIQVLCGNTGAGAACTSTNVNTLPTKYYSYATTLTLSPILLKSVLCPSSCTYTLTSTERFQ